MLLAQFSFEDFAAGVLRQRLGQDDVLGPLVGGEPVLDVGRMSPAVTLAPALGTRPR